VRIAEYVLDTGGHYNPTNGTWTAIASYGAPTARRGHTAVWTGNRMLIWGGTTNSSFQIFSPDSSFLTTGGAYDPSANSWTSLSAVLAPTARLHHSAVWSGSEMLVWGGENSGAGVRYPTLGGRYNPAMNTWAPLVPPVEPGARENASAVWTGTEMIVWGGYSGEFLLRSGGRFDPVRYQWQTISMDGAPSARRYHSAVWTGTEMIIWGGDDGAPSGTGARYNPGLDAWTAMATNGAPAPRVHHTTVWTGTEMIVWGGEGESLYATGGRYDPTADVWRPISTANEASARSAHVAVWTGTEMIVWGGYFRLQLFPSGRWVTNYIFTGARYAPLTDSWTPLSTTGAPAARVWPVAAWTGREMLVWGGTNYDGKLRSGGRYTPDTDTWQLMATNGPACAAPGDQAFWDGYNVLAVQDHHVISRYMPAIDAWANGVGSGLRLTGAATTWTGSQLLFCGGATLSGSGRPVGYLKDLYGYTPPRTVVLYLRP
jgi:N-acetylneuraminic acid mutarotase